MKNRELYVLDPSASPLPNQGVSEVSNAADKSFWQVLDWELRHFVCEGSYEKALDRILSSFLANLGEEKQPPAWLSGFYGSGKSHLVKVLAHLWVNTELPSGETARGAASLTSDIDALLAELDTEGKRAGGLWAASGQLSAAPSGSVRMALLDVLFSSAGLPTNFSRASLILWMEREGIRATVEASIRERDREPNEIYQDMYVSDILHQALLEAKPDLAESAARVGERLEAQFPPISDISSEEFLDTMESVLLLHGKGELPLTLVVLDEMQQFIAERDERALHVQNAVEACSSRFGQRVLIVATGQTALAATPVLSKLHDRFPVRVELEDRDVEAVVRQVVLRKRPDRIADLQTELEQVSGEIDRHLDGSKLAAVAADKADLVADYPVLPTRRRFWEKALRSIDRAGKSGVLRSQLRIVHEAAAENATEEVGTVVGGDFLYDQQAPEMLNSGALLNEVHQVIQELDDRTASGQLKARVCKLIFLVSKLEREGINATGVRPVPPMLADLLVEDLDEDPASIRKQVPGLLEEMAQSGVLMKIEDEFQLQTSEGAEWTKAFQQRKTEILANPARISGLRATEMIEAIDAEILNLRVRQGQARVPRKVRVSYDTLPPDQVQGTITIWVQNGWDTSEEAFLGQAKAAGTEDPTVFAFLPSSREDDVREALASHAAARETVDQRPMPQTDEGKAARKAMETVADTAAESLAELVGRALGDARVYMGGGEEVGGATLREAVERAGLKAVARLFSKFPAADHAGWSKVGQKARDGDPDPLKVLGFDKGPESHPVCKAILDAIPATGINGVEIRKVFMDSPYGWPEDAVNSALLVLLRANYIGAKRDGLPVEGVGAVPPRQVGVHTFFKEEPPPTANERMAVRGLLTKAAVKYTADQEAAAIPALLQHLRDLASRAGGDRPLPEVPVSPLIEELASSSGNRQIREAAAAHEQLAELLDTWGHSAKIREGRVARWHEMERLLRHAGVMPIAEDAANTVDAIRDGRQLLSDPDPVSPILDELANGLREELATKVEASWKAHQAETDRLAHHPDWQRIDAAQAATLLEQVGLRPYPRPDVTDLEHLLLELDRKPLKSWDLEPELCHVRADKALQIAIKKLEPKSVVVNVKSQMVRDESEMEDFVQSLRAEISRYLDDGQSVVIQ